MNGDLIIGPDGKLALDTDFFDEYEFDEDGNLVRKDRVKPGEFGSNLYKLLDVQIDKKVVEDVLQNAVEHYWEENCEGELPPHVEVVEATEEGITLLVHENDDPWSFSVPI